MGYELINFMGKSKTSLHAYCLKGVPLMSYSLLNKNLHVLALEIRTFARIIGSK